MKDKYKFKKLMLSFFMVFLLFAFVGCSFNNKDEIPIDGDKEEDILPDEETEEKGEEEEKADKEEPSIETQIENDVLNILGIKGEEEEHMERFGKDDEGSDDQSINIYDEDGSIKLFLSVSKESTGIDSAGDGPMVGLSVRHDFKREKESIVSIENITKELIKAISKYEYVDWIGVTNSLPKDDGSKYYNSLTIAVERETLDKINWDTFDSDSLESNVDNYRLEDYLQ